MTNSRTPLEPSNPPTPLSRLLCQFVSCKFSLKSTWAIRIRKSKSKILGLRKHIVSCTRQNGFSAYLGAFRKRSDKLGNVNLCKNLILRIATPCSALRSAVGDILLSTIDSVPLSRCLSLCLSRSFKLLLLFCFSMESSHFGRHFSMCPSTKRCSSIFDLGPLTPKIYSPKFAQNRL